MSRQSNIKWRIQDERELAQVARDFNRKLDRLVQENPKNAAALPKFYNKDTQQLESWLNVETIKSVITSRNDYNRMLSMLKRFMKEGAEEIVDAPGNEYGTKTNKWQVQEMLRLEKNVNRGKKNRLKELENVEMETGLGKLGYTLGERFGMGLASYVQLRPTKAFTPSQAPRDVNFKFASLMKQSDSSYYKKKDKILKDNFIRELERNYRKRDVLRIIIKVQMMDDRFFALKFVAHGDKMEEVYSPERGSAEYWENIKELKRYWLDDNAKPPVSEDESNDNQ